MSSVADVSLGIDMSPTFAPFFWGELLPMFSIHRFFHLYHRFLRLYIVSLMHCVHPLHSFDTGYHSLGGITIVQAYMYFPHPTDRTSVQAIVSFFYCYKYQAVPLTVLGPTGGVHAVGHSSSLVPIPKFWHVIQYLGPQFFGSCSAILVPLSGQ